MRFGFMLSEVSQGLRRNIAMVISIILVTFISLTFVGTASLLQLQIGQMKNYWYDKAQVAIYLCTDVSPEATCPRGEASEDVKTEVQERLDSPTLNPFIEEYYFEDHDQAYANFQEQFSGNAVAQYVRAEQLNETYWVNLFDPNQSQIITESFTGLAGVEEVRQDSLAALSSGGRRLAYRAQWARNRRNRDLQPSGWAFINRNQLMAASLEKTVQDLRTALMFLFQETPGG